MYTSINRKSSSAMMFRRGASEDLFCARGSILDVCDSDGDSRAEEADPSSVVVGEDVWHGIWDEYEEVASSGLILVTGVNWERF